MQTKRGIKLIPNSIPGVLSLFRVLHTVVVVLLLRVTAFNHYQDETNPKSRAG